MQEQKIRRLLITEDEPEIREILKEFLSSTGAEILEAANGKDALELLANHRVDAIISDIAMPVMNGIEFLSIVTVNHPEIPVVMLTAFGDKENVLEALRLGAADFIEKPFSHEKVLSVVTRALDIGVRNRRIQNSLQEGQASLSIEDRDTLERDQRISRMLRVKNNQEAKRKKA